MFGMQDNTWIWIILAFFLLFCHDGCGFNLDKIFGCGDNMIWIVAIGAFLLFHKDALCC